MTLLTVGVGMIVVPGLVLLVAFIAAAIHEAIRGPDRAFALATLWLLLAAIVLGAGAATR